jgi:hypothetical protein
MALHVRVRAAEQELKLLEAAAGVRERSIAHMHQELSRSRMANKDLAKISGGAHVH